MSPRALPARTPPVEQAALDCIEAHVPAGVAVCVAFSGGLDSTVLLHALARSLPATGRPVTALHVHHGLSPNADAWARHCRRVCAALGIPVSVRRVKVGRHQGLGLEAAARDARYAAYAAQSGPFVALAHHRDDQAETVLIQLLRGTGLKGLAAMPACRRLAGSDVSVVRPLLDLPREALVDYARASSLAWIEDESNADRGLDRNYLRHEVVPTVARRFPAWREALARAARHAASAEGLLAQLARLDGAPQRPGEPLVLLPGLDGARRANAVRAFLAASGLPMPDEARLAQIVRQLYEAKLDARVRIEHAGAAIVRHRGEARLLVEAPPPPRWRVAWRGEREIALGPGLGVVRFEDVVGRGLSARLVTRRGWRFAPRQGGERLRNAPRRAARTLKNLLREAGLAAWEREAWPLLWHGDTVAWVPGIGIAVEYACPPGEPGLLPSWAVAGRAPLC